MAKTGTQVFWLPVWVLNDYTAALIRYNSSGHTPIWWPPLMHGYLNLSKLKLNQLKCSSSIG
jgi:hypothetical protein